MRREIVIEQNENYCFFQTCVVTNFYTFSQVFFKELLNDFYVLSIFINNVSVNQSATIHIFKFYIPTFEFLTNHVQFGAGIHNSVTYNLISSEEFVLFSINLN